MALSVNWGNHLANGTVFNPETVFGSDGQKADDEKNLCTVPPLHLVVRWAQLGSLSFTFLSLLSSLATIKLEIEFTSEMYYHILSYIS